MNNEIEQLEVLKTWWKEHGKFTVIVIALTLASIMGWQYWQQWRYNRTNQASMLYEQLLGQFEKADANAQKTASQMAQQIITEYPKTPYATLAALIKARQDINDNNLAQALTQLQWADKQSNDELLQQIIHLRAARVLLAMKKTDQALAELKQVDMAAFTPAAQLIHKKIVKNSQSNMSLALLTTPSAPHPATHLASSK